MVANLETDYLVVGAGLAGMAFVDSMLDATDADIVMVDRRHAPGGHWLESYPFVRLHQPSAWYGVGSTGLDDDRIEDAGPEVGQHARVSGADLQAYFAAVMRDRLLPSGRVRYFPMSDHLGEGRFRAIVRVAQRRRSRYGARSSTRRTPRRRRRSPTHRRSSSATGRPCSPPPSSPR